MHNKIPITRTKLLIPQRREELVSRGRLLDMMNDLLDFKLIIVAAPAGYGKTSLIIDFIYHNSWPVCWFALDPLDQDLQRFIAHFICSIQQCFKNFGQESMIVLQSMSPEDINLDFIVSTITNEIFEKISEHFIIVLDDYHFLKDGELVDQFLSDFLQKADENCHLVITSRTLLTLPDLPLLVARAQVGGLSIEELAFTPDEIQLFYQQNLKNNISEAEAMQLAQQSEGWITGLLLTSQMGKQGIGDRLQIARVSGVGLYEYLANQVLEQQPPELQQFLLRSSLLEEFDSEMCAQIIGKSLGVKEDWLSLMGTAIHNNAFVLPVGDEELWLRYHHLFQDFLQQRMQGSFPQESEKILLELAKYYSDKEEWERVIHIYHQLGREDELIDLIERIGSGFIAKGRVKMLSEWMRMLSDGIIEHHPKLLSLQASVAVNRGNIQKGLKLFNKVIISLQSTTEPGQLADNLVRRSSAKRMMGDYSGSLSDAEEALSICIQYPGLEMIKSEALRAKGSNLYQQGKLKEALLWLNESLKLSQNQGQEQDTARLLVEIGATNESLGDFSAAEAAYKASLKYWQSVGDSIWQANLLNNLGVLQHSTGDFENSFFNLEKALQYAQMNDNLRMEGYSLASIGDLYRDLDAFKEAQDAYQKAMDIAQQIEDQFLIFYLMLAQGRVQIDLGQIHQAELLIKSAQSVARSSGSPYEVNKYRMEEALLQLAQKRYSKALENLILATTFFKEEEHLEDFSRAELLQAVSYFLEGESKKSTTALRHILDHIHQPQGRISLLASARELKPYLDIMSRKVETKKLVEEFNTFIADFQDKVFRSRRRIRKHALAVPFAPPKIIIHTFGKIKVIANNRSLTTSDWKTQTSRDLLFFYLSNPEGVTKEEIGLLFWPESSTAELKLRFKNAIYRLRHAIGTDVVLFKDNYYHFNTSLDYEYDVQIFLNSLERAEKEKSMENKIDFLRKAIEVYQGDYLPGVDDDWAVNNRRKYANLYLATLLKLSNLYFIVGKYDEALELSLRAIENDNCSEEAYRQAMQVYHVMKNQAAVVRIYDQCRTALKSEINSEPSPQTRQLYKSLVG